MENKVPIVGKWYKIIGEYRNGFVGECVSYTPEQELSVILEDIDFNAVATKPEEIKLHIKQPTGSKIDPKKLN